MTMNTATVSLAVTPTVLSTFVSHYLNRKPLKHKPTAHLSYDEGLHLIRSFLEHASHHTVEEIQAFTGQWVPHPQWVKVEEIEVPAESLAESAALIEGQLGPDGIQQVGGKNWWQWRRPKSPLKAEWIEMRSDYHDRKKNDGVTNRVMLYVHGGAYFFGSVDEHRYQIQRHARKLKARAIAPRYRLAPQFPFPCGLQDCLATYLYLLNTQPANTIILAGDSAGGGMVMSMLVTLRDRGIPLPAGAALISPWVDLTHSFPSVGGDNPLDYIPRNGFHHRSSMAWPPPNEDELEELKKAAVKQKKEAISEGTRASGIPTVKDVADATTKLSVTIDGKPMQIKEQIQMYTTNELLSHPLVSPVMQSTLGGLPPLLIMVGGGEILRDEQIYLAHKCANPKEYLPAEHLLDENAMAQIERYKPTDVQLQVWDDLAHVTPTLSFTRPAKHMYRSIAQFGAWALARAQKTEIEILDDDQISVISESSSDTEGEPPNRQTEREKEKGPQIEEVKVGRAGDPLPRFKNHMIRQRVTRHGVVYALEEASKLPGCTLSRDQVGVVKPDTVKKWLGQKKLWDAKFHQAKERIHKQRLKEIASGYEVFPEGDVPPPSALAGRRKVGEAHVAEKRIRSLGLSLWALWGSKHDELTVQREEKAEGEVNQREVTSAEGEGARTFTDIEQQKQVRPPLNTSATRSRSLRRIVKYESQTEEEVSEINENTPVATLLALRQEQGAGQRSSSEAGLLTPNYLPPTGVTGKRPHIDGIALPFSLDKEAETASMLTLNSGVDQATSRQLTPAPPSPSSPLTLGEINGGVSVKQGEYKRERTNEDAKQGNAEEGHAAESTTFMSPLTSPVETPLVSPTATSPKL